MKEPQTNPVETPAAEHGKTIESCEPVGQYLKRNRLSQHKTIEEIAATTRIHASAIKAIEEGESGRLPAEVFTRGFIKIYAQYLGLDPDEAVSCYIHHAAGGQRIPKERISAPEILSSESLAEPAPAFPVLRLLFVISLLMLFGLLAYWGYTSYTVINPGNNQTPFETGSPFPPAGLGGDAAPGSPLTEFTPQEEEQLAGTVPALIPGQPQTAVPEMAPGTPGASATAAPAAALPAPEAGKGSDIDAIIASETTSPTPPPLVIGTDKHKRDLSAMEYNLEAEFLETTWVKVEIDDRPVREYTFGPGHHQTWQAQNSIKLLFGNGGGVSLTLNGEKLPPLGPPGRPARITLPKERP